MISIRRLRKIAMGIVILSASDRRCFASLWGVLCILSGLMSRAARGDARAIRPENREREAKISFKWSLYQDRGAARRKVKSARLAEKTCIGLA